MLVIFTYFEYVKMQLFFNFFDGCQSRWRSKHNAVTPLPSRVLSTVNVLLNLSVSPGLILAMLTMLQYTFSQEVGR